MSLHVEQAGEGARPVLVLMHFLGGSGREWDEVVTLLGAGYPTLRIDLPGFGGSAAETGYSVAEMADAVAEVCAELDSYVLVGHSMSGKVSMALARRAADGAGTGAGRLRGLVLVAPSPPEPEPMGEEKRSMMLGLLGARHEDDAARARNYITKNEQRDLPAAVEQRATAEVLRMNRTAWVAWLEGGSKEDWEARVGVLTLPATVVAGAKDASLGPEQQRATTLKHLSHAKLVTVEGCSHLVPMERPEQMAEILREFVDGLGERPAMVPSEYVQFIESERLSVRTREVIVRRMAGPDVAQQVLNARQQQTLRAVCARVVPGTEVDVAGTIMARLATGKGDGWRYDVLPNDAEAYRRGLDRLADAGFADAEAAAQDAQLQALGEKEGSPDARWFEELRGDAAAAYIAHPATGARIGFSGPGVGGAFTRDRGYIDVGVNSRESWEPKAEVQQ